MQLLTVLATEVLPLLVGTVDEPPEPEDVKAGWTAFAIWLALLAAVGLLGWSLTKQLRKVARAKDAGVYGDVPPAPAEQDGAEHDPADRERPAGS